MAASNADREIRIESNRLIVEHHQTTCSNRPNRQLRLTRSAKLADNKHIQRQGQLPS